MNRVIITPTSYVVTWPDEPLGFKVVRGVEMYFNHDFAQWIVRRLYRPTPSHPSSVGEWYIANRSVVASY